MTEWDCHHCGYESGDRAEPSGLRDCPECGRSSDGSLTAEQAKAIERDRRYIAREGLISLMNNTKWREAERAILDVVGVWPYWRAETVRQIPHEMSFTYDYSYFKGIPFWLIITLDLDLKRPRGCRPRVDLTEDVAATLKRLGVPFTRESGFLRIWGYARPGAFPVFTEFVKDRQDR